MSNFDRRQFLKGILGNLVQAAGTVVVASATVSLAMGQERQCKEANPLPEGVQERADRLAATGDFPAEEAEAEANEFLNGGFRNTPLGGFRNTPLGAFRNTPLGNFRNTPLGGFRNTPLGSFGNGGWPNGGWGGGFGNGGWPNGGWGGFGNGAWPNVGWRNGW
jgi:hypothetical protein